jgi:hypothetical protein
MMQHPFIDQMVADQRTEELRRRGDTARIARSVTANRADARERRWEHVRHAFPDWRRRLLPTIRLHRTRPLVARHRTAG